jgi:hypothetical protein
MQFPYDVTPILRPMRTNTFDEDLRDMMLDVNSEDLFNTNFNIWNILNPNERYSSGYVNCDSPLIGQSPTNISEPSTPTGSWDPEPIVPSTHRKLKKKRGRKPGTKFAKYKCHERYTLTGHDTITEQSCLDEPLVQMEQTVKSHRVSQSVKCPRDHSNVSKTSIDEEDLKGTLKVKHVVFKIGGTTVSKSKITTLHAPSSTPDIHCTPREPKKISRVITENIQSGTLKKKPVREYKPFAFPTTPKDYFDNLETYTVNNTICYVIQQVIKPVSSCTNMSRVAKSYNARDPVMFFPLGGKSHKFLTGVEGLKIICSKLNRRNRFSHSQKEYINYILEL